MADVLEIIPEYRHQSGRFIVDDLNMAREMLAEESLNSL